MTFSQDYVRSGLSGILLFVSYGLFVSQVIAAPSTHMSATVSSDMTKPTYGFHGQSQSSIGYNQQDGLAIKGQLGDLIGPPLKIANGFGNIITGSALSNVGSSMKTGSALLGIDAKLLEVAGGANLLKGTALYGGALAKTAGATVLGGLPGKMISSIIEMPIKVVALKDIAEGAALTAKGKSLAASAANAAVKGATLTQQGNNMKINGLQQVISGASEGFTNMGNAVQTGANNAASALRYLPIIMNLPDAPVADNQNLNISPSPVTFSSSTGSLFNGLTNIIPGLNVQQTRRDPNGSYAAVVNANSPFNNLFNLPSFNPFLYQLGGNNNLALSKSINQQQQLKSPIQISTPVISQIPITSSNNVAENSIKQNVEVAQQTIENQTNQESIHV